MKRKPLSGLTKGQREQDGSARQHSRGEFVVHKSEIVCSITYQGPQREPLNGISQKRRGTIMTIEGRGRGRGRG